MVQVGVIATIRYFSYHAGDREARTPLDSKRKFIVLFLFYSILLSITGYLFKLKKHIHSIQISIEILKGNIAVIGQKLGR